MMCARVLIFIFETPDVYHAPRLPDPRHILVVKVCQPQELFWRQIENQLFAVDEKRPGLFPGEEVERVPRVVHNTFFAQETLQE